MTRLTTSEFIKQAKNAHGDKYDYSKVIYKTKKDKVCIICHNKDENGIEHGEFWQTPDQHSRGQGCPKCKFEKLSKDRADTKETFIEKANKVHNNKYNYDKVVYKNRYQKVIITCPIHGDFIQDPNNHLSGKGCPICGRISAAKTHTMSNDEYIRRVQITHPEYDYSITNYTGINNSIQYICPSHGVITQSAHDHLYNQAGCPKCNQSHGEKAILQYLKNKDIWVIPQYDIPIDTNINYTGKAYIDFYLPEYNVFIEYNGIQHYTPVKHFGGKIQFEKQRLRDNAIRKYCSIENIKLIEIPWNINLKLIPDILNYSLQNLDKPSIAFVGMDFFYTLLECYSKSNNLI